MMRWLWMTGGLVVWAIQFSALYGLSSLADVAATADDLRWRLAGLGLTLFGVVACSLLLWMALRRRRASGLFADDIAALSAGLGLVAVAWQGFPTVIGH